MQLTFLCREITQIPSESEVGHGNIRSLLHSHSFQEAVGDLEHSKRDIALRRTSVTSNR